MTGEGGRPVIVIGIGSEFRCDDGAGPAVVRRLRGTVPAGVELQCSDAEPARLMETWMRAPAAIVVDTVRGGAAAPGTLHRVVVAEPWPAQDARPAPPRDARPAPPQAASARAPASSHGLGLGAAIELSRALSRLPELLILHAVQGQDFGYGQAFSTAVAAAIDDLASRVRADAVTLSAG